jgi:uncharacterized protein (DUF433 family)
MVAGETGAELLKAYPQLIADLTAVCEYATRAAAEEIVFAEAGCVCYSAKI